jgi:hypothetical protein|tara:strand:- start:102 stop:215 length:114 start_codon:yes stop_codon:yes gene_type:complete
MSSRPISALNLGSVRGALEIKLTRAIKSIDEKNQQLQ